MNRKILKVAVACYKRQRGGVIANGTIAIHPRQTYYRYDVGIELNDAFKGREVLMR